MKDNENINTRDFPFVSANTNNITRKLAECFINEDVTRAFAWASVYSLKSFLNRVVKQCIYRDNSRSTTNDINHHFKFNEKMNWEVIFGHDPTSDPLCNSSKKRVYQVQKKRKKIANIDTLEQRIRKVPKTALEKPKRNYKKRSPNKKLFDDIVYDISPSMNYYSTTKQQRDDTLRLGMHHAEFFDPEFSIDQKKLPPVMNKYPELKRKKNIVIYCRCFNQESSFICLQELFSDNEDDNPIFPAEFLQRLKQTPNIQVSIPEEYIEYNKQKIWAMRKQKLLRIDVSKCLKDETNLIYRGFDSIQKNSYRICKDNLPDLLSSHPKILEQILKCSTNKTFYIDKKEDDAIEVSSNDSAEIDTNNVAIQE